MKESTKELIYNIVVGIMVLMLIVGTIIDFGNHVKLLNQTEILLQQNLTNIKCCGGVNNFCTDTYYDTKDGKCHSTFQLIEILNGNEKWYMIFIPIVAIVAVIIMIITVLYILSNRKEK